MSESDFVNDCGFANELGITDIKLSDAQKMQLDSIIEKKNSEVLDYQYKPKEEAIARTAMADLKRWDRIGVTCGLGAWAAAFFSIHKRTNLTLSFHSRRFVHLGCFFVGATTYWILTHQSQRQYKGISHHLNTRISSDFSQMMALGQK